MKVDRKDIHTRMSQDILNTSRTMHPGPGNQNLQEPQRSSNISKTGSSSPETARKKSRSWHAAAKVYAGVGSERNN